MNRSMEAHRLLMNKGIAARSFGVGQKVKLPGESINDPNVYDFGLVSYDDIYKDLTKKNQSRWVNMCIRFVWYMMN